jgi:hypothetical protein
MEKYLSKYPQSCKIWKFDGMKNECTITLVGQTSFIKIKDCTVKSNELLEKLTHSPQLLMVQPVYARVTLGDWDSDAWTKGVLDY